MSATAASPPPVSPRAAAPPGQANLISVLRSEWIKLRTVRSTFIALGIIILLGVGVGALICLAVASNYAHRHSDSVFDPTSISLAGLGLGQLAVAVLGALMITSEYSTGMIRTSLTAVPRRGRLLSAKAGVFAAVMLLIGEITAFGAFLVGQAVLSGRAPHASLAQANVLRAVIGAGLYLVAIGLLSVAVGALVRRTAATISIMVAFVFVLPGILHALPTSVRNPVLEYWPSEAGSQVFVVHRSAHTLSAWGGFGLMVAFTAVLLALATALMIRRDA